jgi:hypothetical protein
LDTSPPASGKILLKFPPIATTYDSQQPESPPSFDNDVEILTPTKKHKADTLITHITPPRKPTGVCSSTITSTQQTTPLLPSSPISGFKIPGVTGSKILAKPSAKDSLLSAIVCLIVRVSIK